MHISRCPSGRPRIRRTAGERRGGRVAAGSPIRLHGLHARESGYVGYPGEAGPAIHRCRCAGHSRSAARAYRSQVMALPAPNTHDFDHLLARYRTSRAQQALFDVRGERSGTGYDEFVDAAGNIRPAWRELAECVGERGRGGLDQLRSIGRGLVDNGGITYIEVDRHGDAVTNGDGTAQPGPWHLDALPM